MSLVPNSAHYLRLLLSDNSKNKEGPFDLLGIEKLKHFVYIRCNFISLALISYQFRRDGKRLRHRFAEALYIN